jgi:tetratricopeptide (TPR) repeat protein
MKMFGWENNLSNHEEKSVAAIFVTQLDELGRQDPWTVNLLTVLSFLDPECIPLEIIIQGAEIMSNSPPTSNIVSSGKSPRQNIISPLMRKLKKKRQDPSVHSNLDELLALLLSPVGLHHAIEQLQSRALVKQQRIEGKSVLRLHDLVKIMAQERVTQSNDGRRWFEFVAELVCGALQYVGDVELCECWAEYEMFMPHLRLLTMQDEIYGSQSVSITRANMRVAKYLYSCRRYNEAEMVCRRALAVMEKQLGMEHDDTVHTRYILASVHLHQGHVNEAETLQKQVMAVHEKKFGAKHPDMYTMCNLALFCLTQGRYDEAGTLLKKVLVLREQSLGKEHPHTLSSMRDLAVVYQCQGRYGEAETLFMQVLAVREKTLGTEHPDTLHTMDNLAMVYMSQNRYSEAEIILKKVLAIQEYKLGAEHPDTMHTMGDLALAYQSQNRYGEAEPLYAQVLALQEKKFGAQHPDTLRVMQALADVYESQGRCSEAEVLRKQAVAARENIPEA